MSNIVTWVSPNRDDIHHFEVGKQGPNFEIVILGNVAFEGPNKTHTYTDANGVSGELYFVRYILNDLTGSAWDGPYKVGEISPKTVKIFGYSSDITGNSSNKIRVQVELVPSQNIFFTETGQFVIKTEVFTVSDEEGYFEIPLIPTSLIRPAEATYTIKISDQTNNIIIYLDDVEIEEDSGPINIAKLISLKSEKFE